MMTFSVVHANQRHFVVKVSFEISLQDQICFVELALWQQLFITTTNTTRQNPDLEVEHCSVLQIQILER